LTLRLKSVKLLQHQITTGVQGWPASGLLLIFLRHLASTIFISSMLVIASNMSCVGLRSSLLAMTVTSTIKLLMRGSYAPDRYLLMVLTCSPARSAMCVVLTALRCIALFSHEANPFTTTTTKRKGYGTTRTPTYHARSMYR